MTNPESIAAKLQPYLQRELNDTGVSIVDAPVPLTGGNETKLYRFRLAGSPVDLPDELVLRIYPTNVSAERAKWEAILHNCLRDMHLPVPRVFFTGTDTNFLGAQFIIMELMPGRCPLEKGLPYAAELLGHTQARLHEVDAAVLMDALQKQSIDPSAFYPHRRLAHMVEQLDRYPWATEIVQWLNDRLPPQPEKPSICHGDFHPLNLLEEDGKITGVVDWSSFGFGYPCMGVAFTTVIITVTASPELFDEQLESLLSTYRKAYASVRTLDTTHFDYFRVLRATAALYEGASGQEIWATPLFIQRLCAIIKEISDVDVVVPA